MPRLITLWVSDDCINLYRCKYNRDTMLWRAYRGINFSLDHRYKAPRKQCAKAVVKYINSISHNATSVIVNLVPEPHYLLYRKLKELLKTKTLCKVYTLKGSDPDELIQKYSRKMAQYLLNNGG